MALFLNGDELAKISDISGIKIYERQDGEVIDLNSITQTGFHCFKNPRITNGFGPYTAPNSTLGSFTMFVFQNPFWPDFIYQAVLWDDGLYFRVTWKGPENYNAWQHTVKTGGVIKARYINLFSRFSNKRKAVLA